VTAAQRAAALLTAAILTVALRADPASASPDQPESVPTIDVSAFADKLVVLSDSDGNLIAFRRDQPREAVWYGDRRALYALQIVGSSAMGDEAFDVTATDFRSPTRRAGVAMRDGAYTMSCGDATRSLAPLPAAEALKIARSATFHERRWRRNAVGLYRDDFGVYYVIDRATGDDPAADHRVYVGWQGQVLRSPLKLVASDSLGRVYSAANGARRLVITRDRARYIEGAEARELHALDLVTDGPFLYTKLRVYGDAPHGTPCDVLLPKAGG
jgi:hypothetical protein